MNLNSEKEATTGREILSNPRCLRGWDDWDFKFAMPPMTQDREWGEDLKVSTLSSLEKDYGNFKG